MSDCYWILFPQGYLNRIKKKYWLIVSLQWNRTLDIKRNRVEVKTHPLYKWVGQGICQKNFFLGGKQLLKAQLPKLVAWGKEVLHGSVLFCFLMRSLSVTTDDLCSPRNLKVVVCEQVHIQNYSRGCVVLCSHYCPNKRVCVQLVLTYRDELCSAVVVSWYLLYWQLGVPSYCTLQSWSLSSAHWEAYETFQTHLCFLCVCDGKRESEIGLLSKHQVFLFRFLSGHAESHISTSNISEVFYGVILTQCICTVPKGSWIRFSN